MVSCRTRLARNVAGFPFILRLDEAQATSLAEELQALLVEQRIDGGTIWVPIGEAEPVLRLVLRERHLISRDLAPTGSKQPVLAGRAVAFGETETLSVMINEEDHLRLQGMAAGFDLDLAWERVSGLDRELEGKLRFACSPRLGYLTGCPTNVGTGLRASVMLHLPALGMVRSELEKVFTAAQRTGLAVRGMYGEGSRAAGDFYQISNQVTLGRSEVQLVEDLKALVPSIVSFERKVRDVLLDEQRGAINDRASRSYGMLRTARSMPTELALTHLSQVRLGECLGLLPKGAAQNMMQMAVQIQRGHLQALHGATTSALLEVSERDRLRAAYLRQRFTDSSS